MDPTWASVERDGLMARSLIAIEQEPQSYDPTPYRALHEPPRIRWGLILSVVAVLIALAGAGAWLLTGNDGDQATVQAEETEVDGTEQEPNPAPSTSEVTIVTTVTTVTTEPPPTTIPVPTTVPPNADDYGPPTLDADSAVSTVGLGAVTFGMTVNRAQEAAGTVFIPLNSSTECFHTVPHEGPEGITFLVHEGTIERVDIKDGPITTRSGVGIGTTQDVVIGLFGDKIQRKTQPDNSTDLIFVPTDPGDRNYRVVFNVVDGVVTSFKSGRLPQILTETGCPN